PGGLHLHSRGVLDVRCIGCTRFGAVGRAGWRKSPCRDMTHLLPFFFPAACSRRILHGLPTLMERTFCPFPMPAGPRPAVATCREPAHSPAPAPAPQERGF